MFDIDPFKSFIDMIADSTKTIELIFNQDGLKISLLNNSHICFYDAEYNKDFFDYYQVNDVESLLIDSSDLFKILKSSKNGDELTLESNDSYLLLKFESKNGNRRVFELPLIDEAYNSPAPPNVPCDLVFVVDIDLLNQSVSDLDNIVGTDKVKIVVDDNGVKVISPKDSMTGYVGWLDESINGNAVVGINTNYLGAVNKLKKISKTVELSIGSDMPLIWKVASPMEDVKIKGLIAPILEEED